MLAGIEAQKRCRTLPARRRRLGRRSQTHPDNFVQLSHEIRNALSGIGCALDILRAEEHSAQQADLFEIMNEATGMLMALVNNVLDLAKLDGGKLAITLDVFSPQQVVRATLKSETPRILTKGLTLTDAIKPLPDWVRGDPLRLRQILLNLLGNAIKFTPHGTIVVAAEMVAEDERRVELRFSVRDSGIGMSTEVVKRLFHSFVQADASVAGRYGGSGLGLAICRQLAEEMGGRIWVESRPGSGSTFYLQLPFLKVPPHEYDI